MDENCMMNEGFCKRNYTIDEYFLTNLINEKPRIKSQNG
jgi:hypothetical protein